MEGINFSEYESSIQLGSNEIFCVLRYFGLVGMETFWVQKNHTRKNWHNLQRRGLEVLIVYRVRAHF